MKHWQLWLVGLAALGMGGCSSAQKKTAGEVDIEKVVQMQQMQQSQIVDLQKSQADMKLRFMEQSVLLHKLDEKISQTIEKSADVVQDLDRKLERFSGTTTASGQNALQPREEPGVIERTQEKKKTLKPDAASAEKLYQSAYANFEKQNYERALKGFNDFVTRYPTSELADNAIYWAGEIYYSQKAYSKAILEFQRVVEEYPEGNKAPDALYKMGLAYLETQDKERARQEFKRLITNFPYSEAALKAKERLVSLQ